MRILVVEDDPTILSFLANGLREAGYVVDTADNGDDGLVLALDGRHDAAVIDLMLPGIDGMEIIRTVRKKGVNLPVLILSAKRSTDDRIRGLRGGGDDYMVKPFSFEEVLARIEALIRRCQGEAEPTILRAGPVELDLLNRTATRDGKTLDLRPREFSLLRMMMRNPGRALTKTSILEKIFDYSFDPQTNVVGVLVHRLRSKLDKGFDRELIRTVRGVGYALEP